jgi:hypothetical protein
MISSQSYIFKELYHKTTYLVLECITKLYI